jgi:hypothetical protein
MDILLAGATVDPALTNLPAGDIDRPIIDRIFATRVLGGSQVAGVCFHPNMSLFIDRFRSIGIKIALET